jgi:Na+:H+ antiporter, NhaA family
MAISARPPAPRELRQAGRFTRALQEEPTADRARLASLAAAATVSPNERLQLLLHPWTSYVIVPVFALANAGVPLNAAALQAAATSPLTVGIVAGLVVGKAVGITAATWLALRLGLGASGSLLDGIRYGQLVGGASLAGIGFTVALFITDLAFDDPALRELATMGVPYRPRN